MFDEIRAEIKEVSWSMESVDSDVYDADDRVVDLEDVLIILDKHMKGESE